MATTTYTITQVGNLPDALPEFQGPAFLADFPADKWVLVDSDGDLLAWGDEDDVRSVHKAVR